MELCKILWLILTYPHPPGRCLHLQELTNGGERENIGFPQLSSKSPFFMQNPFLKQEFLLSCRFQESGLLIPKLRPASPWASFNFLSGVTFL